MIIASIDTKSASRDITPERSLEIIGINAELGDLTPAQIALLARLHAVHHMDEKFKPFKVSQADLEALAETSIILCRPARGLEGHVEVQI